VTATNLPRAPFTRAMSKPKANTSRAQAANQSTQQIAKNAVRGGPKSVKKDKRTGIRGSAKG